MSKSAKQIAIEEFIAEAKEILSRVEGILQKVEKSSGASTSDDVSSLYRDMHTLKGTAQLFGYSQIGVVAHAMEACLDPIRKLNIQFSSRLIESSLKCIDLLNRMLVQVENGQVSLATEESISAAVGDLADSAAAQFGGENFSVTDVMLTPEVKGAVTSASSVPIKPNVELMKPKPAPEVLKPEVISKPKESLNLSAQPVQQVAQPSGPQASSASVSPSVNTTQAAGLSAPSESTIRVHVSLLDRILNLVGELVLVRNQVLQHRNRIDDTDFLNASKSLDVVTSDLQSEVMKTRMQPIETVVGKFNRVVRDISKDLGKRIDLTLEGAETELDKSLLEAIKDPLTHILRNSCDHGIEFPDERKKAGKPETGHLLIRSFHEGGQVVIEISDDGRGLDRSRISSKAVEKGIYNSDQLSKMSDREICEIIFHPGFSTAAQVTSVSGRGVGMDVVKTNIEKIGGSVELESQFGKGTSLQLRIPLTLAIVPALLVRSEAEMFAIPQVKLVELVRVEPGTSGVEYLQGRPMYRLRGVLLPLLNLSSVTKGKNIERYDDGAFVVVLNADGEQFGLIVDEILDTADIVVKPLSSILKNVSIFSGATILGDGTVALILDVSGIGEYGKIIGKKSNDSEAEIFSRAEKKNLMLDIQEFLLFSLGVEAMHSVPLCLVQRLEEFPLSAVEKSGNQKVIKYRGSLLPLIGTSELLGYKIKGKESTVGEKSISVIVVQKSGKYYGLVVDEILDVVTIDSAIDDSIRDRDGLLGNIIHDNRVIVVIDALGLVDLSLPQLSRKKNDIKESAARGLEEIRERVKDQKFKKIRVIYAEDVVFFRKHVSKVLNDAGLDVTTFEDGQKAMAELDSVPHDQYNLILSDIEMPNMNGLQFAKEVRSRAHLKEVPMIALTTRFKDQDIADGKAAGFTEYLEKLNPEKLLSSIYRVMGQKDPRDGG